MRFRTTILQSGRTATGIQVPDEVVEALGSGRRPAVKVTVNGYTYRSAVATMGGTQMISLSAEHRTASGLAGDEVEVDLELDTAPPRGRDPTRPGRRPRRRARGPPHLRRPLLQQQILARPPGHRGQDRRDPPAPHRQVGRGPQGRSPAMSKLAVVEYVSPDG